MSAAEVGRKLCDYCREGRNLDAIEELYADDVVSVESFVPEGSDMPREMRGKDQIRGKNQWWIENHEVHDGSVEGPFPHGDDRFAAIFEYDVTQKESGERMQMREVAVYTVEDGQVTREEFYYGA